MLATIVVRHSFRFKSCFWHLSVPEAVANSQFRVKDRRFVLVLLYTITSHIVNSL